MRHNKFVAILGVWIVALAFLGFSESLTRIFLVLTGVLIVVLAIRKKPFIRSGEDFINQLEQADNVS